MRLNDEAGQDRCAVGGVKDASLFNTRCFLSPCVRLLKSAMLRSAEAAPGRELLMTLPGQEARSAVKVGPGDGLFAFGCYRLSPGQMLGPCP